jgi:hypothetical protein
MNSIPTPQKTNYIFMTKTNLLILFTEAIAVRSNNHSKHNNGLRGQNADFFSLKVDGTYNYHYG